MSESVDTVDGVVVRSASMMQAVEALNLEDNKSNPAPGINHNTDVDADSGVDESTQGKESGEISPRKSHSRIPKKTPPASPLKRSRQMADGRPRMPRSKSVPKPAFSTFSTPPSTSDSVKKVPMNKIVVGHAPSPNLKKVQSRVGSLANTTHKAGGGKVKIESRKLDWKAAPKTVVVNEKYVPGGGDKKAIESKKLVWNAQSKVGSLNNTSHKAGGGDKKIESQKLDWKTTSKVGSTANMTHKPGGGNVKNTKGRGRALRARSLTRHTRRQTDTSLRPHTSGQPRSDKSKDATQRPATANNDEAENDADVEPEVEQVASPMLGGNSKSPETPSEVLEKASDASEKALETFSEALQEASEALIEASGIPEKDPEDLEEAPPSPGPSPSPSAPPKELLTDSEAGSNKGEEEEENLDDTIAINNISSGSMVQVN